MTDLKEAVQALIKERLDNQAKVELLIKIIPKLRADLQLQTDIITHGLEVYFNRMIGVGQCYFIRQPPIGNLFGVKRPRDPRFVGPVHLVVPREFAEGR